MNDLEDFHCGWWVEYSQKAITDAVSKALSCSAEILAEMGERGKQLMKDKYSIEAVAKDMKNMYDWILKKAEKPAFIHFFNSNKG